MTNLEEYIKSYQNIILTPIVNRQVLKDNLKTRWHNEIFINQIPSLDSLWLISSVT